MGDLGGPGTKDHVQKDPVEDDYPKPEEQLRQLAKTLEVLKGKTAKEVASPPARFRGDGVDLFSKPPESSSSGSGGDTPTKPGGTDDPDGSDKKDPPKLEVPEYCLVRVIDVTLQPGKTYEYRLQVVMANPNKNRKSGIASPTYATKGSITSPWFKVPDPVRVEPELFYYAVDQATKESRKYKGPWVGARLKAGYVMVQAHRWVDSVRLPNDTELLVGEWLIAERMPAYPGEYVGRRQRVEVPYWRYTREAFVLATEPKATKRYPGVLVNFGYGRGSDQPEALLVDFTPREYEYDMVVARTDEKVDTRKVKDAACNEVLMLAPDGSLVLHEGAKDEEDPDRIRRLEKVRKRIKDIKEAPAAGAGGDSKKPFGGKD